MNKVQVDEEARQIQHDERKKLESNLSAITEKSNELQSKLHEMGESNRIMAQAIRLKQEEVNETQIKYDLLLKEMKLHEDNDILVSGNSATNDPSGPNTESNIVTDDIETVRINEGRGRFYVEAKSVGGGSLLLLRGKKPQYRDWLNKLSINDFLKRSQKTNKFRELVIEKLGCMLGLFMVEEEEKNQLLLDIKSNHDEYKLLQKKFDYIQQLLVIEEDAKRRMLLRYTHSIKESATINPSKSFLS